MDERAILRQLAYLGGQAVKTVWRVSCTQTGLKRHCRQEKTANNTGSLMRRPCIRRNRALSACGAWGFVLLRGVRNMRNPFEYGGVVSGEAFCNREKETGDLGRAMQNAEKLFVFSERRYGKTSLVPAALGRLPRKGHVCLMWVCGRQTARRRSSPPWPRRSPSQ